MSLAPTQPYYQVFIACPTCTHNHYQSSELRTRISGYVHWLVMITVFTREEIFQAWGMRCMSEVVSEVWPHEPSLYVMSTHTRLSTG